MLVFPTPLSPTMAHLSVCGVRQSMYARIGEMTPSFGQAASVESRSAADGGSVDGHWILRLTRVLHGGTYLMGDGWYEEDVEDREEELEAAEDEDETEKERDFSVKNPWVCKGLAETQGGGVSFPPIVLESLSLTNEDRMSSLVSWKPVR